MSALLAVLNRCERWLVEYWCSKRSEDAPPRRSAIDPLEMWQFLPFLEIHARTEDGRLLCRLSGTEVVKATRMDATGQYLDEVIAEAAYARRRQLFERSLMTGRPLLYRARLTFPGMEWRTCRSLLLPLRYRGERPDMVLSHLQFERTAEAASTETVPRDGVLEHHEMDVAEFALIEQKLPPPPAKHRS